jgi:hypothetical protein
VFLLQNLGEVVDRSAVGKSSLLRPLEEEEDSEEEEEEEEEEAGLEKNPGLKKKPAQCFLFCFVFLFFIYICPEERVFRVFSVSRILLGASDFKL